MNGHGGAKVQESVFSLCTFGFYEKHIILLRYKKGIHTYAL